MTRRRSDSFYLLRAAIRSRRHTIDSIPRRVKTQPCCLLMKKLVMFSETGNPLPHSDVLFKAKTLLLQPCACKVISCCGGLLCLHLLIINQTITLYCREAVTSKSGCVRQQGVHHFPLFFFIYLFIYSPFMIILVYPAVLK